MKFLLIFTQKSVPQWNSCYYDYGHNKKLIVITKKAYAIKCNIEDLARQDNYISQQNAHLNINYQTLTQVRDENISKIIQIVNQNNSLFYKYHSLCKRVTFLFFQFKIHELNSRLNRYTVWFANVIQTKPLVIDLLSNCYAETNKLTSMSQLHQEAIQRIYKKHQKVYKNFGLTTPGKRTARIVRTLLCLDQYREKLNKMLLQHPQIVRKYNRFYFQQQIQPSPFLVSLRSYFFGLLNGFSVCVMVTSFVLLGVNLGPVRPQDAELQRKQTVFGNQYRLWKSLAFIVLYIWVIATSFYIFDKKRINYSLIFNSRTNDKKRSIQRLGVATLLSIIWCSFFIFYVMDLIGIYQVARVSTNPSYPIVIFFPIIIFGLFLIFILYQFLYVGRGVINFILNLGKIILSLFGIYNMSFAVVWVVEQFVSVVQIFADTAYSICYYSRMLQTPDTQTNPCIDLIIIAECLTIFLYLIRLLQSLRISYYNGQFVGTREMYRVIRSSLYIILASLSLATFSKSYAILWIWVVIAFFTSIYSFFVDILLDWNLFILQERRIVPRKDSIYPLKAVYFMIAYNIIARFAYPITFSPKLIYTFVTHPQILVSVAGVIQLGRRLVWNLLRVENEQIKNNTFFRIRTDYQQKQRRILQQLKARNKDHIYLQNPLQTERNTIQFNNLKLFIQRRNQMRKQIIKFQQFSDRSLQKIQDQAQKKIFDLLGVKV